MTTPTASRRAKSAPARSQRRPPGRGHIQRSAASRVSRRTRTALTPRPWHFSSVIHVAAKGSGGWHPRWPGRRRMLRAMTVDVTVKTVEPTPTAVVVAAATWAEFPAMWGPMLDQVWSFLRGGAPEGLCQQGHNIMLYKDDVPNVEVGVQVSGSFDPAGHVVASALPGGLVASATHTGPIAEIGTLIRRCASGVRRRGTGWPALAGRSTAIPTRRAAISTCRCSGRWWRCNQDFSGKLRAPANLAQLRSDPRISASVVRRVSSDHQRTCSSQHYNRSDPETVMKVRPQVPIARSGRRRTFTDGHAHARRAAAAACAPLGRPPGT